MAHVHLADRSELSKELATILSHEHELFAVSVASGLSYRDSAKRAGFSEDYSFQLMRMPSVRARVDELLQSNKRENLGGIATRAWIETRLVMIVDKLDNEGLADERRSAFALQYNVLMGLAKLKGLIVERKQVASATLDLGKVSKSDLANLLGEHLQALAPGARQRLQRIAAGEIDADAEALEPAALMPAIDAIAAPPPSKASPAKRKK